MPNNAFPKDHIPFFLAKYTASDIIITSIFRCLNPKVENPAIKEGETLAQKGGYSTLLHLARSCSPVRS